MFNLPMRWLLLLPLLAFTPLACSADGAAATESSSDISVQSVSPPPDSIDILDGSSASVSESGTLDQKNENLENYGLNKKHILFIVSLSFASGILASSLVIKYFVKPGFSKGKWTPDKAGIVDFSSSPSSQGSSKGDMGHNLDRLTKERNSFKQKLIATEKERDEIRRERDELDRLLKSNSRRTLSPEDLPKPQPASTLVGDTSTGDQKGSKAPTTFAQRVGSAFVSYCSAPNAQAIINQSSRFAAHLTDNGVSASVDVVPRDWNKTNPVFLAGAEVPVDYWVVRGEGQELLLPAPKSSSTFCEVDDRCFAAAVGITPSSLQNCSPAIARAEGDRLLIQEPGSLS